MRRNILLGVLGIAAVSCGPYKVEVNDLKVDGNITHTIKFDVEDLKKYFKAECQNEVPANQVDDCTNAKMGAFLTFMSDKALPNPISSP